MAALSGAGIDPWGSPYRLVRERGGVPSATSGYYHIIDWTDPENPKDVARYEVPEFGTHNLWVEDDRPGEGELRPGLTARQGQNGKGKRNGNSRHETSPPMILGRGELPTAPARARASLISSCA